MFAGVVAGLDLGETGLGVGLGGSLDLQWPLRGQGETSNIEDACGVFDIA